MPKKKTQQPKPTLKIPDLSKGEKVYLSYSKLNLFKDCPKQFYFRYLREDIKEKPTVWPGNIAGRVFHKAIETAINMKNDGTSDKLIIAELDGKFQEWYELEVEENKKFYKKSKEIAMNSKFFQQHDKMMKSVIKFILGYFYHQKNNIIIKPEKEYSIEWKWDKDIIVSGIVDLEIHEQIDFEIFDYQIFDFKVTKDSTNFYYVEWDKAIQKIMYEYFIWNTHKKFPEAFTYLVFNREDKLLFFKESFRKEEIKQPE